MRKAFYLAYPFLAIILLVGFSVAFNYSVIDVRLDDLNHILSSAAKAQDENKSLGMLARYELIRRRIERGRETARDYEDESRVQAIITSGSDEDIKSPMQRRLLKGPAKVVLNTLRVLMGKGIRKYEEDITNEEKVIEVGYFWERNRHYDKAVGVYNNLLTGRRTLRKDLKRYVLLHQGFCLSMVSKYPEAIKKYETVIKLFPESEAAVVAWRLIDFLNGIETELQKIMGTSMSEFDKAKQLYLLMDYRGAIKIFSRLLQKRLSRKKELEARFLKGRNHEELGENRPALSEYRKVISRAPKSSWAREANRRIYILGEFYERDKEMSKAAVGRIQEYQDEGFFGKLQEYSGMMGESETERKIRRKQKDAGVGKTGGVSASEIEAMLNDLDLTGEEKGKRKMVMEVDEEKKRQVEAKMRDLQKVTTMDNPFRSPAAIKKFVDKNRSQLEYMYQKSLRQGKEFEGKITVTFTIHPDGAVGGVKMKSSSLGNRAFERQVLLNVKRWRFPKVPKKVGALKINYPLEFRKRD